MIFLAFVIFLCCEIKADEKTEFCDNLKCDETIDIKVCGVRNEEEHLAAKVFDNECLLLKYGCEVDEDKAYGIINMKYCTEANAHNACDICPHKATLNPVCGMRKDGKGFRIRLFPNECQLIKYNCELNLTFEVTDFHICRDLTLEIHNDTDYGRGIEYALDETENNKGVEKTDKTQKKMENEPTFAKPNYGRKHFKDLNKSAATATRIQIEDDSELSDIQNIVVVNGAMIDPNNLNASIDAFFASTHLVDMPLKEIKVPKNMPSRRRHVKLFSPIKVYKPYVVIPNNISEDHSHEPTLGSCFHKCPTKCPDTYAPVCGKPGIAPREPSLMFKNHCYMDKAQCKMYWEAKSPTSLSAYYIESAFLFCLGDELYSNYRFLPLIRTLQHMGRLKKKSSYHYRVKNMKFLNNMLKREPRLMG